MAVYLTCRRLGLEKDVQEDGNVTIDLFLTVSVLTEEICVTTAMGCQPASQPAALMTCVSEDSRCGR